MGQPLNIDSESREKILRIAGALVKSGAIKDKSELEEIGQAIAGLEDGYDINILPLARSIFQYGSEEEKAAARIVGESIRGWRLGLQRFSDAPIVDAATDPSRSGYYPEQLYKHFPMPNVLAAGIAIKRADEVVLPLHCYPDELIKYVFEPFGSDRSAKQTYVDSQHTTFDILRTTIRNKITAQLVHAFRGQGDEIRMPPPPFTEDFMKLAAKRLGVDAGILKAWESTPYWKAAIATFYAELLANGTGNEEPHAGDAPGEAHVKNWEESLALRKRWYDRLRAEGYTNLYIEQSIDLRFPEGSIEHTLALTELSRLVIAMVHRPWDAANAPEVFYRQIRSLHRLDPLMGGDKFLRLLTPLVRSPTQEGIVELMKRHTSDATGFKKYQAVNMYIWHTAKPGALVTHLAWLIGRNQKYDNFRQFLHVMLDIDLSDFRAMIGKLSADGADLAPVFGTLAEKFPGALYEDPWVSGAEEGEEAVQMSLSGRVNGAHTAEHGAQLSIQGIVRSGGEGNDDAAADATVGAETDTSSAAVAGAVQMVLPFMPSFKPVG